MGSAFTEPLEFASNQIGIRGPRVVKFEKVGVRMPLPPPERRLVDCRVGPGAGCWAHYALRHAVLRAFGGGLRVDFSVPHGI